jgi:uncharacterized protein (DUF924 family)
MFLRNHIIRPSRSKLVLSTLLLSSFRTMALQSEVVSFTVSDFASKPFIQRALANPNHPQSVLSYFFGVDYRDNAGQYKEELRDGRSIIERMNPIWFGGGPEVDKQCQSFAEVIRQAGTKQLDWNDSVDGLMAQVLLCDQLSRNAFRGTNEAFAYDETAIGIAKTMVDIVFATEPILAGEIYPPYYCFMVLPLMHSESTQIHTDAVNFLEFAKEKSPQLTNFWDSQLKFELEHKSVIDRFGRYPHRNIAKGRMSTPDELEWLADVDNIPLWAKSQS